MRTQKESHASALNMQVSDNLTVAIIPNQEHQFLMSAEDVAGGYGVAIATIHSQRHYNSLELKEGVHFIRSLKFKEGDPANKIYWTKAGVVRLGFFIKSERAKHFRDWAEQVILEKINAPKIKTLPPAQPRKHNRLTPERLLGIMAEVVKIEDAAVRTSIANQLLNL